MHHWFRISPLKPFAKIQKVLELQAKIQEKGRVLRKSLEGIERFLIFAASKVTFDYAAERGE